MATAFQVKHCINTIAPLAISEYKKGKKILPSVCIAQACCESAYMTSPKMKNANAVFGIKVGKSKVKFGQAWKGMAYSTKTKECYDGRTYVQITDMFRAYDSIADSVTDYYDMLISCTRYQGAVGAPTALATITAIKNGGYATSPTYVNTIMSIIKKYNLTQYDNEYIYEPAICYEVGSNYILQNDMNVRKTPSGEKLSYKDLTVNAKLHAVKQGDGTAVLGKGTKVTCKEIKEHNGSTWIRIPSGWVCAVAINEKKYIL